MIFFLYYYFHIFCRFQLFIKVNEGVALIWTIHLCFYNHMRIDKNVHAYTLCSICAFHELIDMKHFTSKIFFVNELKFMHIFHANIFHLGDKVNII